MSALNTKSYYTGIVDNNDLAYVIERFGNPRRVIPAPISRFKIGEHKGKPKINPHVSSFIMKDGRTVSVFHVKPVYYLHTNGEWRPLSEVTTHHGNRKIILNNKWEQIEPWYLRWLMKRCELIGGQVLIPWRFDNVPVREGQEIFFTVTTVYPDPNPETTSVDGTVNYANADWATAHDAADGSAADDTSTTDLFGRTTWTGTIYSIKRGFFLFDTSSIPDTDSIDAATISLAGSGQVKADADTTNINIVTSSPASNTAIGTADYDQVGTVLQAPAINISSWVDTDTTYNDFTFNATGRGNISKTSISKFGGRLGRDIDNSAPTGSNSVGGYFADQTGTTSDPKLAVTHTASSAIKTFIGLASASTKTVNGLAIASVKTFDGLA